jgi:hypothetical protein
MNLKQLLQDEIQESKRLVDKADGVYKRDLITKIEESKSKIKFYIACAILITIKFKMSLVGNLSTCSVCGKRKVIAKQLNKVLSKQNSIDVYLECKDCVAVPLWETKLKDGKQKAFDHYQ